MRASDYCLYRDPKGKFHIVPHDMNEAFRPAGGPGFGGPGEPMMFALPLPGEVLPRPVRDMLGLTPEQWKELDALQKHADVRLATILTTEQNKQFDEMRDRGPGRLGGEPPDLASPRGEPGGFGPPRGGGPRSTGGFVPPRGGVELDPLVGLTDAHKSLRNKVLAVPAWREQYLRNVGTIAEKSLEGVGPCSFAVPSADPR